MFPGRGPLGKEKAVISHGFSHRLFQVFAFEVSENKHREEEWIGHDIPNGFYYMDHAGPPFAEVLW